MKIFHDADGRDWRIKLDAATVQRIRERLGVDLLSGRRGELLWADWSVETAEQITATIFVAVEAQAAARGMDFDQFCGALGLHSTERPLPARFIKIAFAALFSEMARITPAERVSELLTKLDTLLAGQRAE